MNYNQICIYPEISENRNFLLLIRETTSVLLTLISFIFEIFLLTKLYLYNYWSLFVVVIFIIYSPSIYNSISRFYEKNVINGLLVFIDIGFGNVIKGMRQFYKILNNYFNCSELNQYENLFNEKRLATSILKTVPLIFVFLDIMIMGYESFAFTNLIGLSMGSINVGPNDLEKWYFEDLVKLCFTGFVISMVHLTYLSIFDVIMDIFYCHELKRVVSNEEIGPHIQDESFMNGRNLNITSLIRESRQDIGNNSQILNDLIRDEQLLLENAINPLSISWLKYFVSSTSLLKNLQFVNLTNNEDLNELNLRNELFFSVNNSDIYYNKYVIAPRVIPIKLSEKSKWSIYRLVFIYSFLLIMYQFLDILLKFSIIYLLIQMSFWPWNFLITTTLQLIFMVQKIITTPKSTQGEYLSENPSSERIEMANSIEYIPYFRFI
ncbi:transmembrane domain-containing protein [Cryptosporidium parvum]|nr:transmembrane domain-containing protein [Cryptosporidium sp. 43IA8]